MRSLFFLLMTAAAAAAQGDKPVIEVFLPSTPSGQMDAAFLRARSVVNEIYSEIGVRVIWNSSASHPSGCSKTPLHRMIVVRLAATTPAGASESAFAFSNLYATNGPCVTLLMDRLLCEFRINPLNTGFLLGHTLAHEIGHVLQGMPRHSETGVMKDHWSLGERLRMSQGRLHFTPHDVELILGALAAGEMGPLEIPALSGAAAVSDH
jgi:hypothetical protein